MITQKEVRELFEYRDGRLYWKVSPSRGVRENDLAGSLSSEGYVRVGVKGREYFAHRLIWLYHNGYFPENQIDHINRKRDDNRIKNLREASRSCNLRNMKLDKRNTSGITGVCWNKYRKKWVVSISSAPNRNHYVGLYKDFDEAVMTRLAAEQCVGYTKCNGNSTAYKYLLKMRNFGK